MLSETNFCGNIKMKNSEANKRREASLYEWFSDEANYFYCNEAINLGCAPHFHSSWEFIFVAEGRLNVLLDGEEFCVGEGDVLFIPGFVVHRTGEKEKNRCFSFVFGANYKRAFEEEFGKKQFDYILKSKGSETREIFSFVEKRVKEFDSLSLCERYGLIYTFLGAFARLYPLKDGENNRSEKIIVNLLRYLDTHYTENVSVDCVAQKFGYSKNYLSALFNKYTRMRFSDYLNRLRVNEAVRLIEKNGSIGVTEAALDSGFNSLNTFYRAKKKFLSNKK